MGTHIPLLDPTHFHLAGYRKSNSGLTNYEMYPSLPRLHLPFVHPELTMPSLPDELPLCLP